jgi:hypothetical protein
VVDSKEEEYTDVLDVLLQDWIRTIEAREGYARQQLKEAAYVKDV